jgi:hypothetical protein
MTPEEVVVYARQDVKRWHCAVRRQVWEELEPGEMTTPDTVWEPERLLNENANTTCTCNTCLHLAGLGYTTVDTAYRCYRPTIPWEQIFRLDQ